MSDNMTLRQWEAATEGTYPGYSASTGEMFDIESRAYASLSEVIDESDPTNWRGVVHDRTDVGADPASAYEPDYRIAAIANLLLAHGWRPPEHLAYTPVALSSWETPGALDSEHYDFGAIMQELHANSVNLEH